VLLLHYKNNREAEMLTILAIIILAPIALTLALNLIVGFLSEIIK
jgi:hypothetical protein